MSVRRFVVPITVDAAGAATVYSPALYGALVSLRYVKTDFANGVDFVVTLETTGETVWSEVDVNASATRYPRAATHDTTGAAALYAALGTAVSARIVIAGDRIKVVVAQGGVSTSGAIHFTIDG